MKSNGIARHFLLVFIIALVGYAVVYSIIEHRRTRNGPWQITFTHDVSGTPAIVVNQPGLAITNLWIVFAGGKIPATNFSGTLTFTQPQAVPFVVPFGQCVFMDMTSLPGTIAFELFGHEIQLIPRVLTIDKKERAWESNTTIPLPARNTTAPPAQAP